MVQIRAAWWARLPVAAAIGPTRKLHLACSFGIAEPALDGA
jgi:hypothetical protein